VYEAQIVRYLSLPSGANSSKLLEQGKERFNSPAAAVASQRTPILSAFARPTPATDGCNEFHVSIGERFSLDERFDIVAEIGTQAS
jgi:hypothetical protein